MTAPMKISPGKLKAAVSAAGCPTITAGVSELISIIGKQRHDAEARTAQIKDMQADLVGQRSDVEEMLERMDRGDNRAAMEIGRDLLDRRERTRPQRNAQRTPRKAKP